MKIQHFVRTIPAALAMQASKVPAYPNSIPSGGATDTQAVSRSVDGLATLQPIMAGPVIPTPESFERTLPHTTKSWQQCKGRYEALVIKEALGEIQAHELAELDKLQVLRRRLVAPPSGEEVLQRHRREKADRELVKTLQRYVRLEPVTSYSP